MLEKKLIKPRTSYVGVGGKGGSSVNSSRSGSPHTTSPSPASFIPQPKGAAQQRIGIDKSRSRPSSTSSTSSIPHLPVKSSLGNSNSSSQSSVRKTTIPGGQGSNSMLDKFKLFNPKEKSQEKAKANGTNNKRTSSSSGFSSARSERSDSSTSLCGDSKGVGDTNKDLSSPSPTTPSPSSGVSKPPQIGSSVPKIQTKKVSGIVKQNGSKPRTVDGKDPISSKLEQLKATSKIAKERSSSEKPPKSSDNPTPASNEPKASPEGEGLKFQSPRTAVKPPSPSSNSSPPSLKKEDSTSVININDHVVRQSKVVTNLTDKSSSSSSLSNAQSGSSQCLTSMENCNGLVVNGGSSIPKPTLAVKGTTKVTKEADKKVANGAPEGGLTVIAAPPKKLSGQEPPPGTKLPREDIYVAVHIAGPDTTVLDTGQQQPDSGRKASSGMNKTERSRSESRSGTGVSIAMVSPIMSSNHSSKDRNHQNSDLSSSDPKTSSPGHSFKPEHIYETCGKISALAADNGTIWEEGEDVLLNIKPMQPIAMRTSHYGYMRGLGPLSSPRVVPARLQSGLRVHSDYGDRTGRQYISSLDSTRLYSPGVKRVLSGCGSLIDDFGSDADAYDLASGYLSDGDILRPGVGGYRTDDIASGYLSEGGTPVYTRKVLSSGRAKEREQKIINVLQDDRTKAKGTKINGKLGFDDSSSVSSGVSDTFPELSTDENLTGSSVSSDNAYASLRHHHSRSAMAANGDKARKGEDQQPAGGSSSGKTRQAHVKKTDSAMQTETSAFHQGSASAWKKYLLQQQECQSVKSDKGSKKSLKASSSESKKSSSSNPDSSSSHRSSRHHKLSVLPDLDAARHQQQQQQLRGSNSPRTASCESLSKSAAAAPATAKPQQAPRPNGCGKGGAGGRRDCSDAGGEPPQPQCPERRPAAARGAGKAKVCGSTQTTGAPDPGPAVHSDGEYSSLGRKFPPPRQYFMTTPGPGTGLKERVYGSRSLLNGSPTPISEYGVSRAPRLSGPLRDADNYASLDHGPYATWMRHSPSCGAPVGSRGGALVEADSMESLSSTSSSIHAQIQHARANSLTHARLMLHQRELAASPRLSRSNSIRSTKSEKLASYMLQRSDNAHDPDAHTYATPTGNAFMAAAIAAAAANSQPTSPSSAPQVGSRYNMYPLSPGTSGSSSVPNSGSFSNPTTNGGRGSASMSPYMTGLLSKMNSKDDDMHGSALSLVSTSSSIYSTAEEKQAHEIRKLKRELEQAHEKVSTLTSQLTTNAHMVAAFEQSLSNMTSRLQHLTASAEQKDSELTELRRTIEALKQQSAEAGLTKMALQSMQAVQKTLQEHRISRQFSTDSMSSVNSCSSACSGNSGQSGDALNDKNKKKKKGWLRSSFSKAFSRSKKNKNGSVSDVEDIRNLQSDSSAPNSPHLGIAHMNGNNLPTLKQSHSSSALYEKEEEDSPEVVKELKKQLREKDMMLTDIRLDALSSAHQLENLKETVNKMRNEMLSLKQDNERLQRLVSTKSLTSSHSSLPLRNSCESLEKRLSVSEHSGPPSIADMYLNEPRNDQDGKLVNVSVFFGCHGDSSLFQKQSMNLTEVLIGTISISSKTKWDLLDNVVKRTFKEYVLRVDPVSNLGLNAESVVNYHVGEVIRAKDIEVPDLLPCGYIVGDSMHIKIVLKGTRQHSVDALAFESLIPKSIVQRYVSLLTEHRRIILCGPSGTGKTYIAQKLAEYLVLKNGRELAPGSVATFSVDHKSAKELRQYLSNVAEQCENSNASDLPTVIILDNLHHVGSLGEVFNGFLSAKYQKCPYIIGTMNQATCSTTNLQLHHNFRWVLCANHMEPVKGFLGRYLKRKLVEEEVRSGIRNAEIAKVIDWMPKVWQHLNKYLETHNSSDVTIGPRLFLSCPVDLSGSQVWFTDLWNYSIVPYVLEAVREGLQLYGRRAPWEDPAEWVYETYPWPRHGSNAEPQLLRLRPEDVGYEGHPGPAAGSKSHKSTNSTSEADPLLNMLMRLQEAASYSSPHSNDSDSTSMDSHGSSLHSEEMMNSGVESTL